MKSGKMLLGLISGAAAGAALGLLFAPKKGKDTRKAISDSSNEAIEGTKGKFNEFSDSLSHKVDALKNKTKASLSNSKADQKAHEAKAEDEATSGSVETSLDFFYGDGGVEMFAIGVAFVATLVTLF